MTMSVRVAGPLYLFVCLLSGGSAQGILSTFTIQLTGLALVGWMVAGRSPADGPIAGRFPLLCLLLAAVWAGIQLVPLPPAIWTGLAGRGIIERGFADLHLSPPWMSISLQPDAAVAALLATIPGLATYLLTIRGGQASARLGAIAVLLAAAAGIVLGLIQIAFGDEFYIYPVSNVGTASGFFANSNHMAAFLLVTIPFYAALLGQKGDRRAWRRLLAGSGSAILVLGIILNGSAAILFLLLPVLVLSAMLWMPAASLRIRPVVLVLGLLATAVAAALLLTVAGGMDDASQSSLLIRREIWSGTVSLVREFGLLGTGLGTFPVVYPLVEDPNLVDWVYVNHAHNDYLEMLLELGLPGAILILAFLGWWGRQCAIVWRSSEAWRFALAGSIASGALLLHTLVDFPLRTSALAALFGFAVGLMVIVGRRGETAEQKPSGLRHLTLDDIP